MRQVKVSACALEAQDVLSLVLEPADGVTLPPFEAGAHVDIEIEPGLVRQYSLCPPAHAPGTYRIAIQREVQGRGGSLRAHERLRAGVVLGIGEPRNFFRLAEEAPHSVLLAGGIGITPLLAMAGELRRRGAPFELHYSARSAGHAAFARELASSLDGQVRFHYSQGQGAARLDIAQTLANVPPPFHLYVCGPQRYTDAVVTQAKALGWRDDAIHRESFSPAQEPSSAVEREFVVVAASSGATVKVPPGQSIVAALAGAGIEVATACEQGVCGTCLTAVREGVPDHRDTYLTEAERAANTHILPCCSRAHSPRLVLEI